MVCDYCLYLQSVKMVVISYGTIKTYAKKNKAVEDALNNWYVIMQKSDFANFSELKETFNSVDVVQNDLYIFNIKGNHYRLIARIHFRVRTVYIRFVGAHKEYDKIIFGDL